MDELLFLVGTVTASIFGAAIWYSRDIVKEDYNLYLTYAKTMFDEKFPHKDWTVRPEDKYVVLNLKQGTFFKQNFSYLIPTVSDDEWFVNSQGISMIYNDEHYDFFVGQRFDIENPEGLVIVDKLSGNRKQVTSKNFNDLKIEVKDFLEESEE